MVKKTTEVINQSVILEKARKLFWKNGYNETTMIDLARNCACQPSNIYHYFASKENILYEVIRQDVEELVQAVRPLSDDEKGPPPGQLEQFVKNHVNIALSYGRVGKCLFFESLMGSLSPSNRKTIVRLRDEYDRILQNIIQRGIDGGYFSRVDVKIASYCIASMIIRASVWYSPRGRLSKDEITDIILNFAFSGLGIKTDRTVKPKSQ